MQEEIMKIIEQRKKHLPQWIMQFEILNELEKRKEDLTPAQIASFCRGLSCMRMHGDIRFIPVNANTKTPDKFHFKIILKKVGRSDLLADVKLSNKLRRGSFIYCIK